jgi:hypothetical protein
MREINALAQKLFDITLHHPRMHEWYPCYRVEVIGEATGQRSHNLATLTNTA